MPTTIWRFSDSKAGHDAQSRGLVCALQARVAVSVFDIPVRRYGAGIWSWLCGRYRPGEGLPAPDLLLGAGHATHWHLLAARRRWGGRSIVLMQPSLPSSWFDLCLVPEHDQPRQAANVIRTQGALNSLQPGSQREADTGLIVLGGSSRHFQWESDQILTQIERLIAQRPVRKWMLTTSRRTPESLLQRLPGRLEIECVPYASSDRDWLPARLADAGEVWVSEDSVAMIYEALSAGARVGLLKLQRRRQANRITRGVDSLVRRGWVGEPGQWRLAAGPDQPLNEAARCADWIRRRWLANH